MQAQTELAVEDTGKITNIDVALGTCTIHRNLTQKELVEASLKAGDGVLTRSGALSCRTGEHTGRSPKDKFIVKDDLTEPNVDWGTVNQPISPSHFARLYADQLEYIRGKELYQLDAFAGAELEHKLPIRVLNESAWANLFAKHMFIRPKAGELGTHVPQFTIVHTPNFAATPSRHGTRSGTFIVTNFREGLILIGGTTYAGEMKKSIFGVLNYLYPFQEVLPMHCSANIATTGPENSALFFGLSGTGKTTLSADPNRRLIGDDEHGWSNKGIFNFEGGCYAKCINLKKEQEPQIWSAIRDGAILENVVVDPATGEPDYTDVSLTENTRAAYPVEHIDGAVLSGVGESPKNIFFLTCDAFGVMPPISKLTPAQAMYHFLSGYTAKVAGTEKGLGKEPEATFSTCYGSPFFPLRPTVYADMLGEKLRKGQTDCWLINTGWIGGGVGIGNRIKLQYTRRMVEAALNGELKTATFKEDPNFGMSIPEHVEGVPDEVLNQRSLWKDQSAYEAKAKDLAQRFAKNFQRFEAHAPELAKTGGPKL